MDKGMEKALGVVVVAGIVLVGTLAFVERGQAPEPGATPAAEETAPERTFSWRFEFKEADGELPPSTHVSLITNGDIYDLGRYAGSCAKVPEENLLENEVSAVLCWWAGAGDELGVFKEGDRYIVKQGIQDEGTAEEGGFRGDFQELVTLQ